MSEKRQKIYYGFTLTSTHGQLQGVWSVTPGECEPEEAKLYIKDESIRGRVNVIFITNLVSTKWTSCRKI